jgi:ribonuclease D
VIQLVTKTSELEAAVAEAGGSDRYAIDTEFHRERTYFPQVALIQLTVGELIWLIDPLEVEVAPLAPLLESDALCIVHAGVQDLEVLELVCGSVPSRLFDTQIAAGFLGVATGSLSSILDRFLDVDLPKGDRLTDWLRRPLTDEQMHYAAADVEYLLPLTDLLRGQLDELGRTDWALEESQLLLDRPRTRRPPEEAVLRIKEARGLRGKSQRVATAVAAWRERRAAELNVPPRQVLSDLGVVAVAQQAPTTFKQLKALRGVDSRHLRNGAADEILEAVKAGLNSKDERRRQPRASELPRHLRPVVTLATAWVSQLARDNRLDPALLATRSDVESLLRDDPDCRLHEGWRQDLVGTPIDQLVAGEAAVAFDGDGHLVLEARSHRPLGSQP